LLGTSGQAVSKFDKITVTENGKGAIAVEVSGSATATIKLKKGDPAIETSPGAGASRLRVEAASENFLLHLGGKGDSIVMAVFENRDQDVKLSLTGAGDQRTFTGSEIQ